MIREKFIRPRPVRFLVKLSALLLVYLNLSSAGAQVFNSSVSLGTGGTGRGAVQGGDAVYLNPATLVHLRGKALFSGYLEGVFAVTLSDNSEDSFMPASIGYIKKYDPNAAVLTEENIFSVSLAEFVRDKFAVGLTGLLFHHHLNGENSQHVNADLGFIYTASPELGLGLVIHNVFGENSQIPAVFRRELKIGAGVNYIYRDRIRLRADVTSKSELMAGIETYLNDFLISRLGTYQDLDNDRSLLTVGAGFKGPKFHLNYAYEGNPQNSADYRHSVDLLIPF